MIQKALLISLFKYVASKKGISALVLNKAIKLLSDPKVQELITLAINKIISNLAFKYGPMQISQKALTNSLASSILIKVFKSSSRSPKIILKALKGLAKTGGYNYAITQLSKIIRQVAGKPQKNPTKGLIFKVTSLRKPTPVKKEVKIKKNPIASLVNPRKKAPKKVKSHKNPKLNTKELIYAKTLSITVLKEGKKEEFTCGKNVIRIYGCSDGSLSLVGPGAGKIPVNNCKVAEIKAIKGPKSLWPGQKFKHTFSTKPILTIINPLTIKIKGSKPLHKLYDY